MDAKKTLIAALLLVIFAGALWSADAAIAGQPVGGPFLIADQEEVDTVYPSVAHNTIWDEYLVVWENDRPGFDDIYGQLVARYGALIGGWRAIAAQGAERRYPDVAYSPNWNDYLVVWEHYDPGSGDYSIRGTRVDSSGQATGNEIIISEVGPYSGFRPRVAHSFTSGYYLVVWQHHTLGSPADDIRAQLVSNTGALSGGNFTIAQGTWQASHELPDLAYNRRSNEFLVAWQQLDSDTGRYDIYARIVRPDGSMAPTPIEIDQSTRSCTMPVVGAIPTATAAGQYLVVWQDEYTAGDNDIWARIVYGNGSPAAYAFFIAFTLDDQIEAAVAGNERSGTYLVSWTEDLGWSNIHAREIKPDGSFAGNERVLAGKYAHNSAVSHGPSGAFLAAYDDQPYTVNRDIWGYRWSNQIYLPLLVRH